MRALKAFHAVKALARALAVLALAPAALVACGGVDEAGAERAALSSAAAPLGASGFAIRAERGVRIERSASVLGGDVGVVAAPAARSRWALRVETHALATGGARLIAPSLLLARGAVAGEVLTDRLDDRGATHGAVRPFSAVPAVEPLLGTIAGGTAATVETGLAADATALAGDLPAGAYGDVVVEPGVTLRLAGGDYELLSLRLAPSASVVALSTARVRIAQRLDAESAAVITIADGAGTARDLLIEVGASDPVDGDLEDCARAAVRLGERSVVRALLSAPAGLVVVGPGATVTGAIAAGAVVLRTRASIVLEDGFGDPACTEDCDDGNVCTIDSCVSGACDHAPAATGSPCSDGDACNGEEACDASGACVAGPAPVADDGNPCTADSCDPTLGVAHAALAAGTSCSDGDACNGAEACDGSGACVAGAAPAVDDGNPCTADSCDPVLGIAHVALAAGTSCSDGNACNGLEVCGGGACVAGTPPAVDDGNPCTADACDPVLGVSHVALAAGASCSDGNACNGLEVCGGGACVAGTPPAVDDGNPCTADACDPAVGPTHVPLLAGTSCSDGNVCNGVEACDGAGACQPGTPIGFDDSNPCTVDFCDPAAGVQHIPLPGCFPPPGGGW